MEDKRIKSALEIAMEKAASLPDLTEAELTEQIEKEHRPRGITIARRYLDGALRQRDLEAELRRYTGRAGEIVRKAFLLTLCQSIEVADLARSRKAIDGIQALVGNRNLEAIKGEVAAICDEFRRQREERYSIYENREKEKLRKLWIAGSAVKPNLEESKDWQEEQGRIQSEYDSRINRLREELSRQTL